MKGIVLAGGKGTRLHPLTKVTNKHLLPVGLEPMIFHPVRQLVGAGIQDILIITSTEHMGEIVRLLGSGKDFGARFTYRVQEEALGIADALALGEDFAGDRPITVLLGDNIFTHSIAGFVDRFLAQGRGARVLLKSVDQPSRYGVAALDEKQVIEIEEKPERPKSPYAVVGAYCYDPQVWDILRTMGLSPRGEYEITSVNNRYIQLGELAYDIVEGGWTDAGTFESLAEANAMMLACGNRITGLALEGKTR
ncbi:sugar phosphate nucleotidyltransferase [Mesoterricola sediminis]|uniref:glucose-1-phosphate thymidylyltransferase n=1 Tax=Mesoterricola sediminis TaxID=2927980 RepID=A0AA48H7B8_9BACT|nr:sugar phosphate nucleotidyltransferase [Mesoterricola sediminis]BDU78691.1 glucose-1-phosphate thymidylyltransferase [Mesoterricola sediminis]